MISPNWLMRGEYLYDSLNGAPSVMAGNGNFPGIPSGYSWSNTNVSVALALVADGGTSQRGGGGMCGRTTASMVPENFLREGP
jgi:hypothetical protein